MAGPIQLGDMIKLTELAWTVYDYGWNPDYNASENYSAFGADVLSLHESLKQLDEAIARAQDSPLVNHSSNHDISIGDIDSLNQIIGDYNDTLRACKEFLVENRRYVETTGRLSNIEWNVNAMPRVNHLRDRIQMHNIRIQHFLRPLQIDLITNLHRHTEQRLTSMHTNIVSTERNLQTLIEKKFPDVASDLRRRAEEELHPITISDQLANILAGMFQRHQLGRPPTLPELVDCFLKHFKQNLASLSPTRSIRLVKCQYLINSIKESDEMRHLSHLSHWPGYIRALEADLSHECLRYQDELRSNNLLELEDEAFVIWPTDSLHATGPPPLTTTYYELLIQLSVVAEPEMAGRRTLSLYKRMGSAHRFRIIEDGIPVDHTTVEGPRVVDFDTCTAVLIPIYADPVWEKDHHPPLSIVLENDYGSYKYTFLDFKSLFLFQEVITGYEVAGLSMESDAKAIFVERRRELTEDVTIQIWIPCINQSQFDAGPQGYKRRTSSVSTGIAPSIRSASSQGSSGSEDTIAVRLDNGATGAGSDYGIMRRLPKPPLLVLFTRPKDSKSRSMVTITLDDETRPNPASCQCLNDPYCLISTLERRRGSLRLDARKLGVASRWNLLSLPQKTPVWDELVRISIVFPTLDARLKIMGCPCNCSQLTERDLDECMRRKHQGRLGLVKNLYRRSMGEWRQHGNGRKDLRR